jgi:hypothetical protein
MIRFIDIGLQISPYSEGDPEADWPRQFAFFNTIDSQFVKINGEVVFDGLGDLISQIEQDDVVTPEFANRLFGLTPEWVRRVPAPRNNMQIFGFKG